MTKTKKIKKNKIGLSVNLPSVCCPPAFKQYGLGTETKMFPISKEVAQILIEVGFPSQG